MKKRLSIIICVIMLNLVLAVNVFATDFSINSGTSHSGWSPNWGGKTFNVDTSYFGNQYESGGIHYVDTHDYIVSIYSSYPPEITRGSAQLSSLELLNTSDTTVSTLHQSNFSQGLWRSYYFDPARNYLCTIKSYSFLQDTAGTHRTRVNTLYSNYEFGMSSIDTYYSLFF